MAERRRDRSSAASCTPPLAGGGVLFARSFVGTARGQSGAETCDVTLGVLRSSVFGTSERFGGYTALGRGSLDAGASREKGAHKDANAWSARNPKQPFGPVPIDWWVGKPANLGPVIWYRYVMP